MCDYSLELYRSRPAVAGEKLTLRRFPTGSMGFVSGTVCDTAVCIPAESRLLLDGIGESTQEKHGVGAVEEAVLTRLKRGPYKDAVRFSTGTELVLQRFAPGLTVRAIGETFAKNGVDPAEAMAGADIVITSYALFRIDYDSYASKTWAGLVLDEAQFVKNHQSKAYQCARKLPAAFKLR